jgi:hypothetical protein
VQKKIDKYLTGSRKGRGGQLKVGVNDEAIAEAKKYFGYFLLAIEMTLSAFALLACSTIPAHWASLI